MKSPIPYVGGKSHLAGRLVDAFPEHTTYCEVFGGAAWVLFTKQPSRFEIVNDINNDLITFWRVVKYHLEEFYKELKFVLASRLWWTEWKTQLATGGLTDIQRAARFFVVQRQTFAGRVYGQSFRTGARCKPAFNLLRLEETLSQAHIRLSSVTIEHLPYEKCIERFDRPETLFYIDPPYYNCEDRYGKDIFAKSDFTTLATQLSRIQGRFVLSLNDTPEVREIFQQFEITPVQARYTCKPGPVETAHEVIIRN
ncbi:DNA adenine methylase [Desulfovibrio inopinatus]|uniref:DNA adenine methylase n=1 Tax=Desulfovibrio inopinatus TaxID=102109 RepID=UPI00040070BD|nr:DNA adenine methylase [Desulfovibrio inopinatus]